jgi:PAS domain S-box-containing protein
MSSEPASAPEREKLSLLERIIAPPACVTDEAARVKHRSSLLLIVFLIVLTSFESVVLYIDGRRGWLVLPTLVGLIAAYVLFKRNQARAGGIVLIAALWLTGPFSVLALNNRLTTATLIQSLMYPLIALLVGQSLLPRRPFIGLVIVTVIFIFIPPFNGNLAVSLLFGASLVIIVSSLAITFAILNGSDRRVRDLAVQALRESEARYRLVTELVSDFVYKVRLLPDGVIVAEWTAGAVEKVLGYTPISSKDHPVPLISLVVPEDLPDLMKALADVSSGEDSVFEARFRAESGEIRWLRIYMRGEKDATGSVNVIYGAAQDVTARKTAELALLESEKRLRVITDANIIGFLVVHEHTGIVTFANDVAVHMLGYESAEEVVGRLSTRDFMRKEDRQRVADYFRDHDYLRDFEMRNHFDRGVPTWLSMTMARARFGDEPMIIAAFSDISARKAAEAELSEQRTRYETLVNSVDGVVYTIDAETRHTLFISPQVESLTGYQLDLFYAQPDLWLNLIHPDDREAATAFARRAVEKEQSFQQEYRMVSADGRIIWLRDVVKVARDETGRLLMRGLGINITASREAREAEERQRRLSDALRDTASFISSTLDLNEVLDRILEQLSAVVPAEAADIMLIEGDLAHIVRARGYMGRGAGERIVETPFPIHEMPTFVEMMNSGRPLLIPDVTVDPRWKRLDVTAWIRSAVSAPVMLDGRMIGFLNCSSEQGGAFGPQEASALQAFADQTAIALRNARLYEQTLRYADLLEARVAVRESELEMERQRNAAMLDATGDGIFYTEDDTLRYVNEALTHMTGFSEEELIGQPVLAISVSGPDDPIMRRGLERIMNELRLNGVWTGEIEMRRKDGSTFFAGITINRIGLLGEGPLRAVSVMRDISKEKALRQQQSNLVAYASHELRTPITNLKTRLYLLRRRPEQLETHLDVLESVTERMKRLVEDLLDISRIERGVIPLKRTLMPIGTLVSQIVDIQMPEAARKHVALSLEQPEIPVYADIDPDRMAQVITNLITNALNHTPSGGRVVVTLDTQPEDGTLTISVCDTGIGIAAEHLPHLFQPFYRVTSAASAEGTGLGLSIARQIVELHDGEISVVSLPGEGSTFTVTLNMARPPDAPPTLIAQQISLEQGIQPQS